MEKKSKTSYTVLRRARIAVAAAVFILLYISLSLSGPVYSGILEFLTSLQLLPSLINVLFAGAVWLSAGFVPVMLLTLLVGRLYCSTLCPLGILQDLILFFSRKVKRRRMHPLPPGWGVHLTAGLLSAGLAAAGIPSLLGLLEPFAFRGRTFRDFAVPAGALASSGVVEVFKLFDVYLAPVPFRGEPGAVALTAALIALLIFFTVKYGRWYCNRLCPAGCALRVMSLRPVWSIRFNLEKCTSCGICARVCRSGCIDVSAHTLYTDRCVMCLDCLAACPFEALEAAPNYGPGRDQAREKVAGRRNPARPSGAPDLQRRKAVLVAAGALAAAGGAGVMRAVAGGSRKSAGDTVIPPGARSVEWFTSRCISCHTCVSACPTHVLQPSFFALGAAGFLQPVMNYRAGYCEWECNACSQVCPTGAISPISIAKKQETQLGRVEFVEDRCVVFTQGTACGACGEVCPTQAVRMVPYIGDLTQPLTDNAICSGCGNCEYACPVEGEKAIFVRGLPVHQPREVRERLQSEPELEVPEEFPF
ncbi:MAG: 4Fe-4S binding protein [Sediminispirochaetaceae bacterium]